MSLPPIYFCLPCHHSRMKGREQHACRCSLGHKPQHFKKPRECGKFEAANGRMVAE